MSPTSRAKLQTASCGLIAPPSRTATNSAGTRRQRSKPSPTLNSSPIRFGSSCCYICFTSTRLHAGMLKRKCRWPSLSACSTFFFVFQANFRSSAVCSRVGGSGRPIASQAVTASPCCRSSTSTSNEAPAGKWSTSKFVYRICCCERICNRNRYFHLRRIIVRNDGHAAALLIARDDPAGLVRQ